MSGSPQISKGEVSPVSCTGVVKAIQPLKGSVGVFQKKSDDGFEDQIFFLADALARVLLMTGVLQHT